MARRGEPALRPMCERCKVTWADDNRQDGVLKQQRLCKPCRAVTVDEYREALRWAVKTFGKPKRGKFDGPSVVAAAKLKRTLERIEGVDVRPPGVPGGGDGPGGGVPAVRAGRRKAEGSGGPRDGTAGVAGLPRPDGDAEARRQVAAGAGRVPEGTGDADARDAGMGGVGGDGDDEADAVGGGGLPAVRPLVAVERSACRTLFATDWPIGSVFRCGQWVEWDGGVGVTVYCVESDDALTYGVSTGLAIYEVGEDDLDATVPPSGAAVARRRAGGAADRRRSGRRTRHDGPDLFGAVAGRELPDAD